MKLLCLGFVVLLLGGCGQLNRDYTLKFDAAENSVVNVYITLEGFAVEKTEENQFENQPEIQPELVIPLLPE